MKSSGGRMIGMAHGYGLSGSGSNLWTRSVVKALCSVGETVHLMCQDSTPERYAFVGEVREYGPGGKVRVLLDRKVDFPGRAVIHRTVLDVLPTYVRPSRPSERVVAIVDLTREQLEDYLGRNVRVLERIVEDEGVGAFHVNHVLLLAEAFRRLKARTGTAYGVMPHGSAIEYVVRRSEPMKELAGKALAEADRVFALNLEVRSRLAEVFPELELAEKTVTVRAGVDVEQFRLVPRGERRRGFERLREALAELPRGRSGEVDGAVRRIPTSSPEDFVEGVRAAARYDGGKPDATAEEALGRIRWGEDGVVLYVGRLIGAKGVASLLMALPGVLRRHPEARLVLVGAGPLREVLQAMTLAASAGDVDALERILRWGERVEDDGVESLAPARHHLDRLRGRGELEGWLEAARGLDERVAYTGYLEHEALCHLFPLADAAVFPSIVAEASPLVVAEAASSGVFPLGTDHAGMAHVLRDVGAELPDDVRELLGVSPDPEETVDDIVRSLSRVLASTTDHGPTLRRSAEDRYDWRTIARGLAEELHGLTARAESREGARP